MIKLIQEAVESKDNLRVRDTLKEVVLWGKLQQEQVHKAIEMVKQVDGVFEPNKGTVVLKEECEWTKDYLDEVTTGLDFNFSEERYCHFCEVADKINARENIAEDVEREEGDTSVGKSVVIRKKGLKSKLKDTEVLAALTAIVGGLLILIAMIKKAIKRKQ